MPDQINFLNDERRRYKILYIPAIDVAMDREDPWDVLGKKLQECEPGTMIASIHYDYARQSHGLVLFNEKWNSVELGTELPRYQPPPPTIQLPDHTIIDVEFSVDDQKRLER